MAGSKMSHTAVSVAVDGPAWFLRGGKGDSVYPRAGAEACGLKEGREVKTLEYNSFFKKSFYLALALTLAVFAIFLFLDRLRWGLGVLVGGAWMFINFFLLFRLLPMGMGYNSRLKNRILLLCVIKFPVLYTAGYLILTSRFFPALSLLMGLSIFFIVLMTAWSWMCLRTMNAPKAYQDLT
jgi:hypothetical protein